MSSATSCSKPVSHRRAGERGSAYLFALLVLLVLSVIGLSLALITQTEVQISGAERQATRTFYASDSGLRIQLASHMVTGDVLAHTRAGGNALVLGEKTVAGSTIQDLVEVSPFYPIFSGYCNLCMVNQDAKLRSVNHVVTSTSLRIGVFGVSDETEQSRKTTSSMYALQPWEPIIAPLQQAGDLSTIKY